MTTAGAKPNIDAKNWLLQNAPYAYNNAQRIVIVANKCAKPPGLFSNPVKHLPDLEEACQALMAAIEHHNLMNDDGSTMSPSDLMTIFSEAHPNWRNAYNYLNTHSPLFR